MGFAEVVQHGSHVTRGGTGLAEGTPAQIMKSSESLTGQYLTGFRQIDVPKDRRPGKKGQHLKLIGASENNLKNVSIDIPLGTFTCVTGVSGGGKSRSEEHTSELQSH